MTAFPTVAALLSLYMGLLLAQLNSAVPTDEKNNDKFPGQANLSCQLFGGPSEVDASEMVYWREDLGGKSFVSPFASESSKYVTLEPDEGSWDDKRMTLESAFVFSVATGRTLVLPPKQEIAYEDFFDFGFVKKPKDFPIEVITMEEFLRFVFVCVVGRIS